MLLKKYVKQFEISKMSEVDRVYHLVFFHLQHSNLDSFSKEDVKEWFSALNWPEPNTPRLWGKLKIDRRFVKGKNDSYKLHGKSLDKLENNFSGFNFEETYVKLPTSSGCYVDKSRLHELQQVKSKEFDFVKLVELCDELNKCLKTNSILSIGLLVRAVIDHIPPIFNCNNFKEVCNNYQGSQSFKQSMKNLDLSSRKIADRITHTQIRKKETLPTLTQVDFTNDLDVLLEEIVRILK